MPDARAKPIVDIRNRSASVRTPATPPGAGPVVTAFLAVTLFMLSADRLFLSVDGNKIKYGYFLILGMWLFKPARMFDTVLDVVLRLPKSPLLLLLPLSVSVATSARLESSILWSLWLGFDLFAAATVYAFLGVHRFSIEAVQRSAAASLGLIAFFGLFQFVSIYAFGRVVFDPQFHLDTYRINGLSGWPHFLNIFAFLLLPLVLLQDRPPVWTTVVLALLVFVLVQSTAKTGWVLFVALGGLLALLDRRAFVTRYSLLLVPLAVVALLLPTPSHRSEAPAVSASEKVATFAADLDLSRGRTSGTDRMMINEMGIKVWLTHPWFGVGPNAYDTYVFTRFDQELPGENKLDANGDVNARNENIWIEFLAENGALFTVGFAVLVASALRVRRWRFSNPLHLGAWMALVLYFAVSGQVSQNGLLTMVYALFGIYFYARESAASAS